MARRYSLAFCLALVAILNIGMVVGETRTDNNNELISQVSAPADESGSQEDSKEKRSQEEIMFGNQQNKPNGLVDDLMGENADDDSFISSVVVPDKKDGNDTTKDESSPESTPKAKEEVDPKEKRTPDQESQEGALIVSDSDGANWYSNNNPQVNNIQYLGNPTMQRIPLDDSYNNLYDQEDLYRRKRQLLGHPLPLRKRSLRSPLGQMIQTRGRRLPRRSMRLKRQVDVEDLLSLLGEMDNDRGRYYEPQQQVSNRMNNGGYPDNNDYGYPYSYIRRVELPEPDNMDNGMDNNMDEGMSDIDSLMMMPPNSRYVEGPDMGLPYRSREDENMAIQKWLSKHATPSSAFSVSRRSTPLFYPVDYRYVPGYKKRSRMGNANRRLGEDDENMGQWGQVVAVPEAYASAEDVARLYALANLMAEGEEEPQKMRRSA